MVNADYARGFRAGIEAAAKWHAEQADSYFRQMDQTPPSSNRSFLAGRHSFHRWAAEEIRTIAPAAPEPSEAEKVDRVREAVKLTLAEIGFMDPEWKGSDADADKVARAALAAMK